MSEKDSEGIKNNQSPLRQAMGNLLLRGPIGFLVLAAVLFVPAGRLDWLEAWAFLIFFFGAVLALWVWGWRHDPALMQERSRMARDAKGWDKALMGVYTLLLTAMLILAGLDAGRFRWSSTPLLVRALGWAGLVAAMAVVWWVMSANPFLSRGVRIQEERGHQVVTAGPYQYVRHPMYVGTILSILCIPLVLGSCWALFPAGLIVVLFFVRTALEDRTLREELPGYSEYAERVRYRLLPGVW